MPRYTWAADPSNIISGFETRHAQPDSGALLAWAVLSVESLHYLADIDQDYEISHHVVGGHSRDIADVAHARWATGTCITSLDLCAAALGRTFCGHKSPRELALSDFDTSKSPTRSDQVACRVTTSVAGLDARFTFGRTIQRTQDCSRLAHTFARNAALRHHARRASSATANRLGHHPPKYQRGSRTCERPCNRNRFEAFGAASAVVVR
jgi:hypothetical protein